MLSIHFISNYSDKPNQVLPILLFTYLAQLLSIKVLYMSPYNIFTTIVTVEVNRDNDKYTTKGSTSGLSTSSNSNNFRTIKHTK